MVQDHARPFPYFEGLAIDANDGSGNLIVPSGSRVREVTAAPPALKLSQGRLDLRPGGREPVTVTTNFAEPFAYQVQTQTADGGDWLVVSVRATGLPPGVYRGAVTIRLFAGTPAVAELPVSLTVPP